jgi:hypothetical protein
MPPIGTRAAGWVLALVSATSAIGVDCAVGSAFASPAASSAADLQAARELFGSAEADEDAGRWQAALDKLHRILATKDTAGVRYHVALCEEQLGKLAHAEADFAVADTLAMAEQARDVMRLVGKKRAELGPRVPHVTVLLIPASPDAAIAIDGKPIFEGEPTSTDPGSHEIEVSPAGGGAPSTVTFTIEEGETKSVPVNAGPASATTPPPAVALAPAATPASAGDRPGDLRSRSSARTGAWLETAGAVLLAGAGVAAYAEGGAARDQAARSCATVPSASASACDADRVPVRTWDWVAIGAWAGAGAMATWAVISWTHGPAGAGTAVLGPGSVHIEGTF